MNLKHRHGPALVDEEPLVGDEGEGLEVNDHLKEKITGPPSVEKVDGPCLI